MNRVKKIYALLCPDTNEVKYIGVTIKSVKCRLSDHISEAKRLKRTSKKAKWIGGLIDLNKKPKFKILEKIKKFHDWEERERYWITLAKELCWDITNETIGGRGCPGYKFDPVIVEELKLKKIGKPIHSSEFINDLKNRLLTTDMRERQGLSHKKNVRDGKIKQQFNSKGLTRAVLQLSINGEFIYEYSCTTHASEVTGIKRTAITENLRGANKTSGGYIFRFKELKQ